MIAAPSGSVPTMEVIQGSGASGEIIGQMDASLLEVSKEEAWTALGDFMVQCGVLCA